MKISFSLLLLFLSYHCLFAQEINISDEAPVAIGNINMESVIIHVYKSKDDIYPYKEFIITKDSKTGELKAISSTVFGKVSKGGFIIVNGIKNKSEVLLLLDEEKVYEEMVVNEVPNIAVYEKVINDYIKTSILEEETEEDEIDSNKDNENTSNLPIQQDNTIESNGTKNKTLDEIDKKIVSSSNAKNSVRTKKKTTKRTKIRIKKNHRKI